MALRLATPQSSDAVGSVQVTGAEQPTPLAVIEIFVGIPAMVGTVLSINEIVWIQVLCNLLAGSVEIHVLSISIAPAHEPVATT